MADPQTPVVRCTRCGAHYFPSIEHLCADVAALIKKRGPFDPDWPQDLCTKCGEYCDPPCWMANRG